MLAARSAFIACCISCKPVKTSVHDVFTWMD
jgi:hypothetical protein